MTIQNTTPLPIPLPKATLFCSQCGTPVEQRIPTDDTRMRAVCPSCGHIHYDNPKMVVGTLAVFEGQVLLCRRGIDPGYGKWTLPAGFMEIGESMSEGALRETREEANVLQAQLIEPVYQIVDIPMIGQTHIFFRADLLAPQFSAGQETLDARLFAIDALPWDEIAFESVRVTLRAWVADSALGQFRTAHTTLIPPLSKYAPSV